MSTFETPAPQPDHNPNVDIELPDIIDDEWCADFNARYGYAGKRAVINAYEILRDARLIHGWERPASPRNFYPDDFGDLPEEGLYLDGEVVNARLVPLWDGFSQDFEYVVHLAMRDVCDVNDNRVIAGAREEVWVPLTENGDTLVLY